MSGAGEFDPRYVVHPGRIDSKRDGQIHFISFADLVRLYRVNPARCTNAATAHRSTWPAEAVHLYPDYNGDYSLPVRS